MSPSQETSGNKKDNLDYRKSKQMDHLGINRGYETVPQPSATQSISGLSKSIAKEKFHQQNLPMQQKMQMHVFNNKLSGSSNGFTTSHTLKKSASTRQVVNLLDFQSNGAPSNNGASHHHQMLQQ